MLSAELPWTRLPLVPPLLATEQTAMAVAAAVPQAAADGGTIAHATPVGGQATEAAPVPMHTAAAAPAAPAQVAWRKCISSLYMRANAAVTAPLTNLPPVSADAVPPTTAEAAMRKDALPMLLMTGPATPVAKAGMKPCMKLSPRSAESPPPTAP